MTFSNGIGSQSFVVPIVNNGRFTGDRTFYINLSTNSLTGLAQLLQPSTASVTITDNLSGLSFSSPAYTVNKNGVASLITVLRSGYTTSTNSVDFFTADGTGKAGVNYYQTNGTLTFTNGETAKSFWVTNIDDHAVTGDHTVLLGLTNLVGNAVLVNPSSATLTILETDGSLIKPAGAALISESFIPANGIIDPGETVSLWFAFRNATGTNTADLVATLLATNGVSTTNGQSQHYGVLVANGPSVSRPFAFTAVGTNGQTISATFQLRDSTTALSNAVFNFILGSASTTWSNSAQIVINDYTNASPYPATVTVGAVGGSLSNLTVTLKGLYHTYPSDIDAILVSPTGIKSYLMAKCGAGNAVQNVSLTFDAAAPTSLTATGQIVSGTNRPTSFAVAPPPFQPPAPPAPYTADLSLFNGSNPNGDWSLFVIDDAAYNSGVISNGWSITLTSISPVGGAADLVAAATGFPNPVTVTSNVTYSISITNFGPSTATNVVVTNSLPATTVFVPGASSPNSDTNTPGLVIYRLGTMAKDAFTNLTVAALTSVGDVTLTNLVWVAGGTPDPNGLNNTNLTLTIVTNAIADLELDLAVAPDPVPIGATLTYTITVLNHGPSTAPGLSVTDTLPPLSKVRFLSASPAGYATNGSVVTFTNLGSLLAGAQTVLTINVQPLSAGLITNTATTASAIPDPLKGNNTATAKALVQQPPISALVTHAASFSISWSAAANTNYVLEYTDDLSHPNWTPVTNPLPVPAGDQYTVTVGTTNGARFFRLRAPAP